MDHQSLLVGCIVGRMHLVIRILTIVVGHIVVRTALKSVIWQKSLVIRFFTKCLSRQARTGHFVYNKLLIVQPIA